MELRLHNARATQDIDLGFRGAPVTGGENQTDYIQRLLAKAAQADKRDFFSFEVGGVQMELDGPLYGGARYPVRALVDDRLFVAFHVEAAVGDYLPEEIETAVEADLLGFAGVKPAAFPMIPREVQFAEKLHSYTMPRSVPNSRARDLYCPVQNETSLSSVRLTLSASDGHSWAAVSHSSYKHSF